MRRAIALTLFLGLVVAACNSSEEGSDTTTSVDSGSTTTADGTDSTNPGDTTTPETDTTEPAAPTTTTAAPPAAGSDCLVGTWTLDSDAFVEQMGDVFAETGVPDAELNPIGGTFIVEMRADGTMRGVRDQWGFEVVTPDGTVRVEVNGEETGTWSADDSTLTVTTESSDLAVDASMEVNGQVIEIPPGTGFDVPDTFSSESTYTCSGDVLNITNEGVSSVMNRT